jgi:hypothetical protein
MHRGCCYVFSWLTSKLTLNTPKNTNRIFSVANSNWACSILIVNRGIVASPTFNGNPALFVIPCNLLGRGIIDLQWCNYYHLPSDLSSKIQSLVTICHHKLLTREGRISANG